jgi:chromosome condensin MukBEF ATPase and DNA-binding subunit MukB
MHEPRIVELEQLLVAANQSVAALTQANAELTRQVAEAEARNKKLKRSSRNGESILKDQLTAAQNRRF